MNFFESFRVAWGMLLLHKLRAFLTMVGVIIGVMSVTLIVMIASGFNYYLTYQFQKLGADTIIIFYDGGFGGRRSESVANIDGLKASDVNLLLDRVRSIDIASAATRLPVAQVSYLDRKVTSIQCTATDEYFLDLNKVGVEEGRGLTEADLKGRANVCLIGQTIKKTLFPDGNALGKLVTFDGITLQVVGTMAEVDMMGQSNGKDVMVPLTTAQDKWTGGSSITYITTRPKTGYTVDQAMDDIWRVLMQKSNNKRIYRIDSRQSILNIFGGIVGVAGGLLSGVAALSLLVGGIGIMNIMLVSVTERTKEVGLRKAVGARRGAILGQFLVEAALLSMVGGIIGMMIAFGFGKILQLISAQIKFPDATGLQMSFPFQAALMAIAFSAFIGVVFGLYPAVRASSLSPIEALRTE